MDIDARIKIIMEKMEKLKDKNPEYPCGDFPPVWDKPLKEERVASFEKKNGIKLPEDYRRFITTVAGSCSQPFYGLCSIFGHDQADVDINKKFKYTIENPLDIYKLSDEEYNNLNNEMVYAGFIFLCDEGCGMYSILIVNSDGQDTYGTVWYFDLANDAGTFPLLNPVDKKPMNFLDWLEYYADRTLELEDEDFFGYAELTGSYYDDVPEE